MVFDELHGKAAVEMADDPPYHAANSQYRFNGRRRVGRYCRPRYGEIPHQAARIAQVGERITSRNADGDTNVLLDSAKTRLPDSDLFKDAVQAPARVVLVARMRSSASSRSNDMG